MAVARVPPQVANPYDYFGDHAEFGPALFSRLVPFSVHVATSIYEERRDRMVSQNIIPELESLTDKIHEILTSLGLPGSLQALEKPLGLPPSLVQHAEEIRQADAIGRVQKGFADIDKLRSGDMAIFEEGKAALASEEEEDQRLRMRYGTERWVRPESRQDPQGGKLWQHASEIESYFQSSISSDAVVREKFGAIQDLLAILSGPDRDLMDSVPSSRRVDIPETLKPVIGRLRGAYNDVLRLESRRRKKVESLRENARRDDIKPDILKEAARLERAYPNTALVPAHFEEFFDKRLDKLYEPEVEAIEKEAKDQERLLADVQRINREFESQKRQMGERGNREREVALQKLDNAYFKYKEIINNLEVGRKFYNDLNKIVGQGFRDVIRGWVAQRRMEARALEEYVFHELDTNRLLTEITEKSTCRHCQTSTSPTNNLLPKVQCRHTKILPTHMHHHNNKPLNLCRAQLRQTYNLGERRYSSQSQCNQRRLVQCGLLVWESSLVSLVVQGSLLHLGHGIPTLASSLVECSCIDTLTFRGLLFSRHSIHGEYEFVYTHWERKECLGP